MPPTPRIDSTLYFPPTSSPLATGICSPCSRASTATDTSVRVASTQAELHGPGHAHTHRTRVFLRRSEAIAADRLERRLVEAVARRSCEVGVDHTSIAV